MKYLKISNVGLLEIALVSLMGGTTKANDKYKIGQFGSGLKYTLAFLIRNNIDFKIFKGKELVNITTEKETIRGEDFVIICIDGHRTSITTRMGMDWKHWMVIRELYSNALDEGEANYSITEEVSYAENYTTFYIELTPEILQVYNNWNNYFIVNHIPMWENKSFAVHPVEGKLKIFKQGILIHESEQNSVFNYDIKNADINELREYRGVISADIAELLFKIDDPKVITYFLENVKENDFEGQMDYNWEWRGEFSNKWKETIGEAKLIHKQAKDIILDRGANIDLSNTLEVPKAIYKALTKQFEGIGALRVANKVSEFYEILDTDLELKVKQAMVILEECNYFIHPELKFVFGEFGCKDTLAQVNIDRKEILISQKMKDKSLFDFCSMLIEENEHFQTGFNDCTRQFQQHFINLYTKTMLDKNKVNI